MDRANVAERIHSGLTVVEVRGDLDVSNIEPFKDVVHAATARKNVRIVIDLTSADFIDSTVLNVLYASARRLRASGGCLVIACGGGHMRRVLEVSALDRMYSVELTRAAAIERLDDPDAAPRRFRRDT